MKCIDEIPAGELKGKRILLRADFNLPLDDSGEVTDTFRVEQGWQTVRYLSERGAKVILVSHLSANKRNPEATIEPIARALKKFGPVVFIGDITGRAAQGAAAAMKNGEILLLENVRRDPREEANEESFAKELAALADIYVNDSFAVDHRAHASLVGVPKFLPKYAGLLLRDEIAHINKARKPASPSFAILGGAKFETKAPLINSLLATYDHLFITGALANDIFKAKGLPVGRSLISKQLPGEDVLHHPHRVDTIDVTAERGDGQAQVKKLTAIDADDKIVDMGPDTFAAMTPLIEKAQFILWNGPTGLYESGYTSWTHAIAGLLSKRVAAGASVVIGGGDTIAALEGSGIKQENLGFLSTGGGAMLEYLLKGTLPAIEALE